VQVLLSWFVETDLQEIGDYIAVDNPVRAQSFVQELKAMFLGLDNFPIFIGSGRTLVPTPESLFMGNTWSCSGSTETPFW